MDSVQPKYLIPRPLRDGFAFVVAGCYILENYKSFTMYSMEANKSSGSFRTLGRGVLEDYLSSKSGSWVFMD